MSEPALARRSSSLRSSRFVKSMLLLLSILALSVGVTACGGDESSGGDVISVQLGEDGSKYFVKVDKASVPAGTITFKIDNIGTTHHELAIYRTELAPDKLPLTEDDKADLDEAAVAGEAVYTTPVRGDADHRIRDGRGVDYTLDLDAGAYVLLCNLGGHYSAGQYTALTVT